MEEKKRYRRVEAKAKDGGRKDGGGGKESKNNLTFSVSRRELDTAYSTNAGALSIDRSVLKSRDLNQSLGTRGDKSISRNQSAITDMLLEDILLHSCESRNNAKRASEDMKTTLHTWSIKKSR